jgi:hypothetical protein
MPIQKIMSEIRKYASDGDGASIYALLCRKTGELRYIGKANDPDERLKSHMRDARRRNTPLYSWIKKHGQPEMVILARGCLDWVSAERDAIAFAREIGVNLLNLADGGDQPPMASKEALASSARKMTAKRPKYIMRLFRRLECNVRTVERRRKSPYEKGRNAIKVLSELLDACRKNNTVDALNEMIRVKFEWSA